VTAAQPRGYLLEAGQGVEGDRAVKSSGASSGGSLTLIESDTDGGAPWHVHEREDEAFYVLGGKIVVWCGDDEFHAGPRSFVFTPRGIPHAWDVERGERATVLIIAAPGGLDAFLSEFHAASDAAARNEASARYGVTFRK
jgi:mannose-6-phosphate isomerase-like protein (cupin superfamily)